MKTLQNTLFNVNFMLNVFKYSFLTLITFSIILISKELILHPENITFGGF